MTVTLKIANQSVRMTLRFTRQSLVPKVVLKISPDSSTPPSTPINLQRTAGSPPPPPYKAPEDSELVWPSGKALGS